MDPTLPAGFQIPPPEPTSLEQHLARRGFTRLAVVGKGATGTVYRALEVGLGRVVAIKWLRADLSRDARDRLANEAAVLASLPPHPNLVPVYSTGEFDGSPYLVMGFVGGDGAAAPRTLRALKPTPRGAAAVLATLADALEIVHRRHLLHRDLKPENVLLGPGDIPVLVDFGLVHQLRRPGTEPAPAGGLTRDGAGTPDYMAPEQISENPVLTEATDLWALGVILYEQLTGELPFRSGARDSAHGVQERIVDPFYIPLRPRRRNPAVPSALDAICMRCINRDPGHRFPSAEALARDLRRFLDTGTSWAAEQESGPVLRACQWVVLRSRQHRIAVAAVGATLLALATGFLWYWHRYERRTATLFEQWEYRWGVPHGINPVTTEVAQRRGYTYRVWHQGSQARVIRCERIDSRGNLVSDPDLDRAAVLDITYEPSGGSNRVSRIRFGNEDGTELYVKAYFFSRKDATYRVEFFAGGKRSRLGSNQLRAKDSPVVGYRVEPNADGFESKRVFLDANTQVVRDELGAAGWAFSVDAAGRRTRETPLEIRPDYPQPTTLTNAGVEGLSEIEHFHDAMGRQIGCCYRGHDGGLLSLLTAPGQLEPGFLTADAMDMPLGPSVAGTAPQTLRKDVERNREAESAPAKPLLMAGYCCVTNQYDGEGNLTNQAYFGIGGQPAIRLEGYHRRVSKYDTAGNEIVRQYLHADGSIRKEITDPR